MQDLAMKIRMSVFFYILLLKINLNGSNNGMRGMIPHELYFLCRHYVRSQSTTPAMRLVVLA